MLDSKKKKKEKKGMKIARSIKRKKISARERERETFGTRREGWFPFELVAWLDVVSSGPRQHASQTLIKRVAGTRGPTHLSAVCLSSSLSLSTFFPFSLFPPLSSTVIPPPVPRIVTIPWSSPARVVKSFGCFPVLKQVLAILIYLSSCSIEPIAYRF